MKLRNLFRRKRNWSNFDAFHSSETSSGVRLTDAKIIGIPAVFACVRVLSESIASLPLLTYKRLSDGNKTRAQGFSLYDILHSQPNPLMTAFEVREMLVGHLALRGNAYCFIERIDGEVVALWPLHPDNVTVEVKGRDLVYTHASNGDEKKYRSEDILHIRGLSSDGIIGFSPLTLFRDSFGASKAVESYAANYFKNDASPGGILSTEGNLGDNRKELMRAWREGFSGEGNKHRVAILDGGLKWESVSLSPEDSQLIESQKFSVVQIARIFRIPLNLIQDYDRSTYSNVTEQNRSFLVHTLLPYLTRIEQAIHRSLLTESEKKKYFVEHLTHNFLRANTKERYEAYQIARASGFMSVNEIRRLENMNAVSGGDEYAPPAPPQVKGLRKTNKEVVRNAPPNSKQTQPEQGIADLSIPENESWPKRPNHVRGPSGMVSRDRIAEIHRPMILEAAGAIIRRESIQVKKAIKKGGGSFRKWLENFYLEIVPEVVQTKMGPPLKSFAEAAQMAAEAEMGLERGDMVEWINKHAEHYQRAHILSSMGQLQEQLEKSGLEAVEKRIDAWTEDNHRAEGIADNQVVKTTNLVFSAIAFGGGFKIMSNTRGKACDFCNTLNGKIVGRGEPMLPSGDWASSKGEIMNVRRPKVSPAYHRGCQCFLTHVRG